MATYLWKVIRAAWTTIIVCRFIDKVGDVGSLACLTLDEENVGESRQSQPMSWLCFLFLLYQHIHLLFPLVFSDIIAFL